MSACEVWQAAILFVTLNRQPGDRAIIAVSIDLEPLDAWLYSDVV